MKYKALFSGLLLFGIAAIVIVATGGLGGQPKMAHAAAKIKVVSNDEVVGECQAHGNFQLAPLQMVVVLNRLTLFG